MGALSPDERGVRDETSVSMWLLPALLAGIVLFAVAITARAGVYKWTDDQGVVHYSDQLPPDAVNRANVELSRQGIPIRKTAKAVPPVHPSAAVAEEQIEAARARASSERRDRALLDSYSSVAEIDLARDRATSAIDAQIRSASTYVAKMTKRRDTLLAEKASYGTRPVPDGIARELASIDAEIDRQRSFIAARKNEEVTVRARYSADRIRYEALTRPSSGRAISGAADTGLSAATQLAARN